MPESKRTIIECWSQTNELLIAKEVNVDLRDMPNWVRIPVTKKFSIKIRGIKRLNFTSCDPTACEP